MPRKDKPAALGLQVVPPPGAARGTVDAAGLQAALERSVAGEVRFDRLSRALYSTDASVYQIVPLAVVLPRTEEDVQATVEACRSFGVPLTARGGGTSQAGQSIGPGVILDCSKYFSDILELDAPGGWARVRPGCVLDDLNAAARPFGLQFAPDISTSNRATIGGMVANNSSGTRSLIYGKTIDHVLETRCVLADGSVVHTRPLDAAELNEKLKQRDREGACYDVVRRLAAEHAAEIDQRFPKILRRVGGYNLDAFRPEANGATRSPFDLTRLLVGSEGTLAVLLEARLRLVPLPRARAVLVVQFDDLLDALEAVPEILAHGPSAVEVIDRYVVDSTKLNAEASRLRQFLHGDPGAILIIEFSGDSEADLPPRLGRLEDRLRTLRHGNHLDQALSAAEQARIWKLRKLALGLSMAEKGDAKAISFVEDTAVAPEYLRDYIAEFLQIIKEYGTTAGVYAHASVGCLHVRPVVNLKTAAGVGQFEAIAGAVAELVLKYGGALSGEHGDGLVRSPFQEKMFGPTLYGAFREIKRTFDPENLLNPGKIVDAPPLASSLRFGPTYVTPDVQTVFDFSAEGGLTRAAELCAGVGECRRRREGTMCPSYQATGEEQHSTRGRANALRLALTGQAGLKGLTDPAVLDVFDLCLECKACKSECPTNTDVARLKAEFLNQYRQAHGLPLRNRIFASVSLWPWLPTNALARWLGDRLLGIDRRRVPPVPAKKDFLMHWWLAAANDLSWPTEAPANDHTAVMLFPDTFTRRFEPAVGLATVRVLQAFGGHVFPGLPEGWSNLTPEGEGWPHGLCCCGRPMISNGFLDRAVRNAERNVERLFPWAEAGRLITACEPSCLLTIKDDYPALLRGELRKKAEVVAKACGTFEECATRLREATKLQPLQPRAGRLLVQTHCHQRSLVGPAPTLDLLRTVPGAEVIDADAGCCGMAGSFGYEKEHYDVSRLVGEQRLFPAVRKLGPEDVVVANGFSCRLQIRHFTGRQALHPAVLLAQVLSAPS